jgi:hypothetical protein
MVLTTEKCTSLTIGALQRACRDIINRDYPDSTEDEVYHYTELELKKFSANDQHFQYNPIKNKLGGYRWFFLCPKCNARVSKLFLPPKGAKQDYLYLCKKCHGLKSQSAVMGQNSTYRKVTRPLKRLNEIEQRLERGHLTNAKIEELLDEYETIEKELKSTTEYRLYLFKKRQEQRQKQALSRQVLSDDP